MAHKTQDPSELQPASPTANSQVGRLPRSISGRYSLQSLRARMNTGEAIEVLVGRDGRYRLEDRLGKGGMGEVYLAFDTVLERHVALKVVAARYRNSPSLRRRLLQEARALAQIRHPNVLEIYDSDTCDSGELFVTMPHVPGQNLGVWQRQRPLRSVVSKYISAGRGLATAHAQGIVHRDFKPSNVLVDDTGGQVYVADFGLAKALSSDSAANSANTREDSPSQRSDDDERGSTSGAVVGTLPYIAPELREGVTASAASDQYAYCVALWQGVTGALPFGAGPRNPASRPPERPTSMPRWLYRALCRGLALDPRARFASVSAVVSTLERGLRRRNRAKFAALALGVAGAVTAFELTRDPPAPTCASTAAAIDEIWNANARARLERALSGADAEGVRVTDYALAVFNESAEHWRGASVQSCKAHALKPTSYRAMNQRACLDARLELFKGTLGQVVQLGASSGQHIDGLLEPLTQTAARCRLPGPILHKRARQALAEVGYAAAQREHGRAIELASELTEHASAYAEACVDGRDSSVERGEALYRLAQIHGAQESPGVTLDKLAAAAVEANACDHDELLARSYVLRAQVEALDLAQPEAAARSLAAGVARYQQLGGPGNQAAELHKTRALVALARGNPREAIEWYQMAIDSLGDELAAQPRKAKLMVNIGAAWQQLGEFDEAKRAYERAVALVSEALGPEHPESRARRARAAFNVGLIALANEDLAGAELLLAELIELDEPALAIEVRTNLLLAIIEDEARIDDARAQASVLASALEQTDDLPLQTRAQAHTVIGQVFARDADPRGLSNLQRALTLWEQLPDAGVNHDICQLNYAEALAAADELDAAKRQLRDLLARVDADTHARVTSAALELAARLGVDASG